MLLDSNDLPPPPGVGPVRHRPWWRLPLVALIIGAAVAAAFLVPLPSVFAYLPGPVRNIEELVEVSDATTYSSEGRLLMTTVSVDTEVTLAEYVAASFSDDRAVVREEDVTGGQPLDRLRKEQADEMRESKQHAIEVAFEALGLGGPTGDGALVVDTLDGHPADGILRPDDLIVSIDGRKVQTTCDVGRAIDTVDIGDALSVKVVRDDVKQTFDIDVGPNPEDPNSAFLGVAMENVGYEFDPDVDVDFRTGEIAGPSAGLMMSLALYDRLTPDDLTHGLSIAGTGTIACDGGVGAIGGIEQKVAGAEAEGADVFLAPAANADAARAVADDIDIVAVSNFFDALEYLEGLD